MAVVLTAVSLTGATRAARADDAAADRAPHALFAGLDIRTDLGTHVFRISTGVRFDRLSANVVLDPWGWAEGTQWDADAFAECELWRRGWAVVGGWRVESAPVLGVGYYQEKPFVGLSAGLPGLLWGHVRARFVGELALTLVDHGGGLPAVWFWEQGELIRDAFDVGFSARVEYGVGL